MSKIDQIEAGYHNLESRIVKQNDSVKSGSQRGSQNGSYTVTCSHGIKNPMVERMSNTADRFNRISSNLNNSTEYVRSTNLNASITSDDKPKVKEPRVVVQSGIWDGYYVQKNQEHHMQFEDMTVDETAVRGKGVDGVGQFNIVGTNTNSAI